MTDIHQHVTELLPWFVNGTLSRDERRLVQEHVNDCLPCRRAMLEEEDLYGAVRGLRAPDPEEHGLKKLLRSIDASADGHSSASSPASRASQRPGMRSLGLSAAAVVLIVAAVAVLLSPGDRRSAEAPGAASRDYSTLTPPEVDDSPRIDVIFVAGTSPAEVDAVLASVEASVSSGPSAIGRYTLSLAPGTDIESALEILRSDARVRLAARTYIPDNSQ